MLKFKKYSSYISFLGIAFAVNILVLFLLNQYNELSTNTIKDSEAKLVELNTFSITEELNHVFTDLLIISERCLLNRSYNHTNSTSLKHIEQDFLSLIKHNHVYDQVRVIDQNGYEKVRVNYNKGNPAIVKSSQLQNKKNRYFFEETFKLNKGDLYMSPFDLNIENGNIEQPIKPMIRFATPIFDENNNKTGILIINYLGQHIIQKIQELENKYANASIILINKDGYFLHGTNADHEWGFMYPSKNNLTFKIKFGSVWDSILIKDKAQIESNIGLLTSNTIRLSNEKYAHGVVSKMQLSDVNHSIIANDKFWKVVSFIPKDNLYGLVIQRNKIVYAMLIIFTILLFFIFKIINKARLEKSEALKKLKASEIKLQHINNTKDKFFSIIAHDLRNPFNALLGFSDLLLFKYHKYNDAKRLELIKLINSSLVSTYNLLENLLTWSKSQTGGMKFSPKKFDLAKLISEGLVLAKTQADKKYISLEEEIEHEIEVFADHAMISLILRNLLSNAIKFTDQNGKIKIKTKTTDQICEVVVADNGIGIEKEKLNQIFTDKNTSSLGTKNEQGSGLGLMLCKEFIELHNCKIKATSMPCEGSTFIFTVPVYKT